LERTDLNWRGVVIFALAVLTVIVLIRVIDDDPASLGVNTAGTSQDDGGDTVTTTTTTTPGATTTTRPGATTTTALVAAGRATVQEGSSGADVTLLQQRLTTLGYYKGTVDGSFGAGTKSAVVAFQQAKGITPADGVVGPTTWQALATG
jgi:peptidoglycan hydrolase-like protein with peptidoglycan-binding domain